MANPLQRRLTLGVAGFLVLGLLFFGWRWISWSAPAWLADQFEPASLPDTFPEPDTVQTDRLSWSNLSFTTPEGEFSAYEVTLRFSPLSILLGRPQITELELINPLWIGPAELQPSTLGQWINQLDALAPQQLKITNATLALGEQEWLRIEAAAQRLGGSRRDPIRGAAPAPGRWSLRRSAPLRRGDGSDRGALVAEPLKADP